MDNQTFVDKMKSAVEHVKAARDIVSSGPLMFYLENLIAHSEALMTFCPFKIGDRAVISNEIKCPQGWKGQEKTLEIGQEGKVVGVDWYDGRFVVDFVPDKQWYMSYGSWVSVDNKRYFPLSVHWLSPLKEMSGV